MEIEEFEIEGIKKIIPRVFEDQRGYFFEAYNQEAYQKICGKNIHFIQDNESLSSFGTLRGLHFQKPPFAQAKLVRVIKGEVLDVVVDLRVNSKTFGQHQSVILSEENKHQFFIPKGFAHGFVVLSRKAIFSYKVDCGYAPSHDSGILWSDKELNIDWKLNENELILSNKDKEMQTFKDYCECPIF